MINGRISSAAFSASIWFSLGVEGLPCVRLGERHVHPRVVLYNSEVNGAEVAAWDSAESGASQHGWIDMVGVEDKCEMFLCAR
jgi:hypothetical protein